MKSLTGEQQTGAEKFVLLTDAPMILGAALGRISFSVYLLRFVAAQPVRRHLLYVLIVTQVIVNGVMFILHNVLCGVHANGGSQVMCRNILVVIDVGLVQGSKSCGAVSY